MSMFIGHKPERQELQALSRVHEDKILLKLFESRLKDLYESLSTATDEHIIFRLQGKISVLKELLEAAKKSREVLQRT